MGQKFAESPWVRMWVAPRATMRSILESDPRRRVHLLGMLYGVSWMLSTCFAGDAGKHLPAASLLFLCLLLGPLVGLLSLYCLGAFLTWTGRWLGGKGTQEEVRAAYAWGSVPLVWQFGWWFLGFALFGGVMFNTDKVDKLPLLAQGAYFVFMFFGFFWDVWAYVVMVKCMAEAHRFSAWRAWGAMLLSVVLALAAWAVPTLVLIGFLRFAIS